MSSNRANEIEPTDMKMNLLEREKCLLHSFSR